MNATLLVIDPQNDFCNIPNAALPVAGADGDMRRLAGVIRASRKSLMDVIITLDSHATVSVERTTFWKHGDGTAVAPFTEITEQAVRTGRYLPRNESLRAEVLSYLHALEARGRYRLMVWPVHCVVGKGLNPLTEQYSAVRAEVPRADDPLTDTNATLIERARPEKGLLLVAGEASSHCVAATLSDLMESMAPEERARVVILRDCMSPVQGFEADAERFFADVAAQGARVMSANEQA